MGEEENVRFSGIISSRGDIMFDQIEIEGKLVDVYFDIENFKLKVDRYDWTVFNVYINKEIVVLKRFILFIKYCGKCNNYSTEFDVLFYINTDYTKFTPLDLSDVIITSNEISYLLYSNEKKTNTYNIQLDNCEFCVNLNRNNKMQMWYYYDIRTCGNVEIKIVKCDDWTTYGKIINAVINALFVSLLCRRNNNFEILISNKNRKNIGKIVFPKIKSNSKSGIKVSNIDILKKDIKKIIIELIKTPNLSQFFIPEYSNYHTQLEFYKIYACFEYEYNLINKDKLYNNGQKREIKKTCKMKKQIKEVLKKNKVSITEHYLSSLANYNPMEGHKQKLRNGIEYTKKFMSKRYCYINFFKNEQEFIDYIYQTRIQIIHQPDDNIEIENANYLDVFNEIIYSLFLKRCGISNKRIEEITTEIFIPYI